MSTSTRLILVLTIIVGVIMTSASLLLLRQRETAFKEAMRSELHAHAVTLRIALEDYYAAGQIPEAQRLIDRLRQNTDIYGIVLFDKAGQIVMLSSTQIPEEIRYPPELQSVLATGEAASFTRGVNGEEVFSIILPLRVGDELHAAFEISQPLSIVKSNIAAARRGWAITTLILIVTVFIVVFLVLRLSLLQPIKELLGGAVAVGRGDLDYRVIVPSGGSEFTRLAQEFNRMADHLAEQRRSAAREAEERLALERQLRHSERLASVGTLAAGIAHEMGAPLNVIDARAEQVLERPDASLETRQRNLIIIRSQVERITRIVRQLLNLARPYNLRREPVDQTSLIAATLSQIQEPAMRGKIVVEFKPSPSILIYADEGFIRQVLLNICMNALQAMPDGGTLRVECAAKGAVKDERQFAMVRISDSGTGIPPERLADIFDPFYTTKEVGSGTGLGLAVSHRIIEEHGGWITAGNRAEGGAVFTVFIPACEAPVVEENLQR